MHADSLGRAFLTVAHNRFLLKGVTTDEMYPTRVEYDIEGNQREVRDAIVQQGDQLGRIVMRYDYDMLGTRIHHASMEAGERWMLNDVTGKPIRAWNSRLYDFRTEYDPLRRPLRSFVVGGDSGKQNESESETFTQEILFQRTIYGEQVPTPEATNLRGRVFMQLDSAGAVTSGGQNGHTPEAYDFRGNLLRGSRRLATMASGTNKATVDWKSVDQALPVGTMTLAELTGVETAVGLLVESDTFETSGTFDALNRPLTATAPDGSVSRPTYNEAGLLETLGVNIRGAAAPTLFVQGIDYDAKGRRTRIESGQKSGGGAVATTEYTYDPETVRLRRLVTTRVSPPSDFASQVFQSARTLQDLSYTYDPVGNITQIADAALLTTFNNNLQVDPTCLYVYDAIYRLVEATGRELIGQAGLETSGLAASLRDFPFCGAERVAERFASREAVHGEVHVRRRRQHQGDAARHCERRVDAGVHVRRGQPDREGDAPGSGSQAEQLPQFHDGVIQ